MPKRTRTKESGVYAVERADGKKSYEVAYRNAEGRPRSKTFRNFNAARDFKRRSHHEVKAGTYIDSSDGKVTLAEYYQGFRERQLWDQDTRAHIDRSVKNCTFASVPLGKVRATHAEEWVKAMSKSLAPSTIKTRFSQVNGVMRGAVRDHHIVQNPLENVQLPRQANEEMFIPSPETVATVLEASEEHYRAMWALCAFAGLRKAEAAGVQVSDVRSLERRLRVDRQVQSAAGGAVRVKPPKYESNRTIYIPEELVELLGLHIASGTNGKWLFMGRNGNPPRPTAVQYQWTKTIQRAGVDHFSLHGLRHFFASGLIAAGEDVVKVQRQLGHASPSITLDTYSHLWPDAEDTTRAAAGGLVRQVLSHDVGNALGLGAG